jgi:molybdenum transport protein
VQSLREAGLDVPVACTRKHFPGTRVLAAKAVRAGGAVMHSHGLSTLLIRPEHRAFIEPPRQAAAIERLKSLQPEMLVVAQVDTFDDALALAHAGADVLQLEQFEPAQLQALRMTLSTRGLQPLIAPAGGVTLSNAVEYARAGADFLVTSVPYLAAPADIRVVLSAPPKAPRSRIMPRAAVTAG